jgi:putative heme-binding domain-containing protein
VLEFAARMDGEDRVLLEAFGNACAGYEDRLWPDLVARFGNTPTKWSKQFEAIAWRLHPVAAIDAFLARALSGELTMEQRRRSVDALAFIRDGRAADAMVEIALRSSGEVKALAAFWIGLLDRHEWKEFAPGRRLGLGSRDPDDALWRSGPMSAGVVELDVDVTGARSLWLVVTDGGDGYSHDWADWIEPVLSGPEGETRLTELPWTIARAGWGDVFVDHNCGGGPLEIEDVPAAFGVGTHANSEIGWMLPAGRFTRLRAKVGPDDGGTRQPGASTSIEFQVFAESAGGADASGAGALGAGRSDEDLARLRAARERLLAGDTPPGERARLAGELALDPDGGAWLVELSARDALPDDLRDAVAARIFKNPDLAVRALASEQFARVSEDGAALPTAAQILALEGDAARGRALFATDRAGCAKCHKSGAEGGDVGPALTVIGSKYDRAALLDAILNPSAAVAFGFESWIVETVAGDLVTGFVLADGDPLVLKDTTGAVRILAASEVVTRRRSKLSVMPDNVSAGLTAQELADLVEHLAAAR